MKPPKVLSTLVLFIFFGLNAIGQDLVDVTITVTSVSHNFECCTDAAGISCGFAPNRPEPRYRVRARTRYQGTPAAYSPISIINLGNGVSCGSYGQNIELINVDGVCADQVEFEVEMWEEDGCGSDNTFNDNCANDDNNRTFTTEIQNLGTPGIETHTVNGSGGYSVTFEVDWSRLTPPTINAGSVTDVCVGSAATLIANATQTVTGGTFHWYTSNTAPTPVYTGTANFTPTVTTNTTYYVSYGAPGGCETTRTPVSVTALQPTTSTIAPTVCDLYTAPSGAQYALTGSYTDVIPNAAGCDSTITINLTVNNSSTATVTASACNSYTAPSGTVYTTSGNYVDVIPNSQGCDSTISIDLTINTPTSSNISVTACETYTAPSGTVYTTSGNYVDVISNSQGCDSTINIDLTVNNNTTATIDALACDSYTAPSGANFITTGTYTDIITNAQGCDSIITINLVVNQSANLNANLTATATDICEGDLVTFDAAAASNYEYTVNGNVVYDGPLSQYSTSSLLDQDVVLVTVTDSAGCTASEQLTIDVASAPDVDLIADTTICPGTTLTLDATTPFVDYLWNDNSTSATLDVTTAGLYSVEVTTVDGCIDSDSVTISVAVVNDIDLGADQTICLGDSIFLDAGPGFDTYLWSTGETTSSIYADTFGLITVLATDALGCTASDDITFSPLVTNFNLGNDTTIFAGTPLELSAQGGDFYSWSTGETTQTITVSPDEETLYSVSVTASNGCIFEGDILVSIDNSLSVFIPNMFSPNGDNSNDEFKIYGFGISTAQFSIYNKWGQLVYESTDIQDVMDNGWDGRKNGVDQPAGSYVWKISGKTIQGSPIQLENGNQGSVLLVR